MLIVIGLMNQVFRKRRHPVVLLPIKPLVCRIADKTEHPFVRTIAGEIGSEAELAVVAEFVAAAGAVLLNQADAAMNQIDVGRLGFAL